MSFPRALKMDEIQEKAQILSCKILLNKQDHNEVLTELSFDWSKPGRTIKSVVETGATNEQILQ